MLDTQNIKATKQAISYQLRFQILKKSLWMMGVPIWQLKHSKLGSEEIQNDWSKICDSIKISSFRISYFTHICTCIHNSKAHV